MAKFYKEQQFNIPAKGAGRICMGEPQLNLLLYMLASQICKMDDPQYGHLSLSGVPTGEDAEWIVEASMCKGDFTLGGVSGQMLAKQSISAAVNFPDIDLHYTQMTSGSEQLFGNAYFDDGLSVLVLTASGGQLMLALQLSHTVDGDEYAKENLLKAYATAVLVLQYMMPRDETLQSSCVTALNEITQQYKNCMCCDDLLNELEWIRGVFKRCQHPEVRQWKAWQQERPEIKTYFRE